MKNDPEVLAFVERDSKPFRIQGESVRLHGDSGPMVQLSPTYIPWWLAEIAHREYIKRNRQSLKKIAERGGFGREELINLLKGEC